MKTRLLFACQFVSLCASLPLHAKGERAPRARQPDALTERVAALVEPKSEQQAPADGEAGTKPKPKADAEAGAAKSSGDANAKKTDKAAKKKSASKPASKKGKKKQDAAAAEAKRRISLDEDFLVEGKLDKPNAYYILRRSQAGYDWARLDAKFLPLVLESVQDPLF
jgi:hypothetical protein